MFIIVCFICVLVVYGSCHTSFRHYNPRHALWIGCPEGTDAMRGQLENVIKTSFRDYTYIKNATSMCELVSKRLAYRGIVISVAQCVDSKIESEFGSTLIELYSKFKFVNPGLLSSTTARFARQQMLCKSMCDVEKLFRGSVREWVRANVPIIRFEDCYYGWGFNLVVRKGGGFQKAACYSLKSFDPNATNWNFEIFEEDMEPCFDCLEKIVLRHEEVSKAAKNHAMYSGRLIVAVSRVWAGQMAAILSKNASIIRLTD